MLVERPDPKSTPRRWIAADCHDAPATLVDVGRHQRRLEFTDEPHELTGPNLDRRPLHRHLDRFRRGLTGWCWGLYHHRRAERRGRRGRPLDLNWPRLVSRHGSGDALDLAPVRHPIPAPASVHLGAEGGEDRGLVEARPPELAAQGGEHLISHRTDDRRELERRLCSPNPAQR